MTPEEERIAYFYELGRTLAAWSAIEGYALHMARTCSNEELTKNAIGMGFTSIQGFRNKLLFVGAAVMRMLHGNTTLQESWLKVQERLFSESGKRNDLAHYQSREYPSNAEGRRWALTPWQMPMSHDPNKPPPGSYCVIDLVVMRHSFEAAKVKLANFLALACGLQMPFPESDESPENPPTIEQIRRRIHAELGHPHQSSREKRLAESAANADASLRVAEELGIQPKEENGTK